MDAPDGAGKSDMPDMRGLLVHILTDLHDVSARLARLESTVDEFAPLARQYAGLMKLAKVGRGNARS